MPSWLRKTIAIAFAIAWTVLAAEFYLRVFMPVPMLPRYIQASSFGIRENVPEAQYTHVTPEYVVELRTNSQGFRDDREFPETPPPNTKRVLLLGDSFAIGYGVNIEDSVPALLEEQLAESLGHPVEVINMGVSGFGTSEELVTLQERGWDFQPDLVIVYWHNTDPVDNIRSNLFKLEDGKAVRTENEYLPAVALRKYLFSFPLYRWIAEHSQLYAWARETAAARVKGIIRAINQPAAPEQPDIVDPAGIDPSTELSLVLLHQMQNEIEARNAKMVILEIPSKTYFNRALFRKPDRETYRPSFPYKDAEAMGFRFNVVSPIAEFQKHSGKKIYWERSHGHWTPLGTSCVAEALTQSITTENWLSSQ